MQTNTQFSDDKCVEPFDLLMTKTSILTQFVHTEATWLFAVLVLHSVATIKEQHWMKCKSSILLNPIPMVF